MGTPSALVSMARPRVGQAHSYTAEELARYDAIVQRYARHVYNIAYRMAGNEADARDLTQEAFLRVYRALRRVEPDAPLESWLYRIVSNLHIDLLAQAAAPARRIARRRGGHAARGDAARAARSGVES